MANELDAINNELVSYCKENGIVANEEILNFGVRLGRHLESKNLADGRLAYFVEQDAKRDSLNTALKLGDQVDAIFNSIVKSAIKEQIEQHGDWEVGYGSYYRDYPILADDIAEKYSVQFYSVDQPDRHGDFEVYFTALGEVAKILNDCDISDRIFVGVTNHSGDEHERISDVVDVDSTLYNIGVQIYNRNDAKTIASLTKLVDMLGKHYMFLMLKS